MGWEGPPTDFQIRIWNIWFQEQWSKPSRSDHYLMALIKVMSKDGDKKKLEEFVIPFEFLTPEQQAIRQRLADQRASERNQAQFAAMILTARKKHKTPPRTPRQRRS